MFSILLFLEKHILFINHSSSPPNSNITEQFKVRLPVARWVPIQVDCWVFLGFSCLVDPWVLGRALWWVSPMEGPRSPAELSYGLILGKLGEVVMELLPNDLSPQLTFHSLQWEIVVCSPII